MENRCRHHDRFIEKSGLIIISDNNKIWHWFWEILCKWQSFLVSPYIPQRERVVIDGCFLLVHLLLWAEKDKLIKRRQGRRLRVSYYYFSDCELYYQPHNTRYRGLEKSLKTKVNLARNGPWNKKATEIPILPVASWKIETQTIFFSVSPSSTLQCLVLKRLVRFLWESSNSQKWSSGLIL